jgi:hypothetical protein
MAERITVPDAPHDAIVDDTQHLLSVPLSNMNVDLTNGMEQDLNVGGTSIADLAGRDAANKVLAVGSKGSNGLSFLKIAPAGNSSIINQVSLGDSPEEPRFYKGYGEPERYPCVPHCCSRSPGPSVSLSRARRCKPPGPPCAVGQAPGKSTIRRKPFSISNVAATPSPIATMRRRLDVATMLTDPSTIAI